MARCILYSTARCFVSLPLCRIHNSKSDQSSGHTTKKRNKLVYNKESRGLFFTKCRAVIDCRCTESVLSCSCILKLTIGEALKLARVCQLWQQWQVLVVGLAHVHTDILSSDTLACSAVYRFPVCGRTFYIYNVRFAVGSRNIQSSKRSRVQQCVKMVSEWLSARANKFVCGVDV